ncbi:hypothetical protein WHR41_03530 [Cladosporium halotolerans]|uniref:Protein BNI4 n=1 Tax=Cladosporium halotolerans TaxID=1052096 RepID=A0AB34KVM7_9PEZI
MAEVLTLPMTSSSTVTMLQSRPSSSEAFQGPPQQSPRLGQAPRSMYNGTNNAAYRNTASPVQPYAFQSTPHLRQESRTISAPSGGQNLLSVQRPTHSQSASTSTASSSDASSSKDDSVIGTQAESLITLSSVPDLSLNTFEQPAKPSPDRYKRVARRTNSSTSVPKAAAPNGAVSPVTPGAAAADLLSQPTPAIERQVSADDAAVPRSGNTELAKRYRRRSLNTIDTHVAMTNGDAQTAAGAQRPTSSRSASTVSTPTTIRPVGSHQRIGSRDGAEAAQRNNSISEATSVKASDAPTSQKTVNVPPRGASDPNKRMAAPSPLSRQTSDTQPAAAPTPSGPSKHRSYASVTRAPAPPSAAAQHLAAVSDRDLNKGMKSRLRRAFSFGTAQELRRAEGNASTAPQTGEAQPPRPEDELDPEQLEIARRQEAAGIGANIYSGQGGFTGSTDNISISSTASSASMMLRKMGKGAKKSARSIKGLFRPKSVIGVPAADGPVQMQNSAPLQPTMAQVSMVTVEAERQKVNVNAELDDKSGGATGFPKLERNSIDAVNASARPSAEGSNSDTRRSIVGSDKDRAEVLAAVKKGILKRSGTSSPTASPDIRPTEVPHVLDSPASSMPSTPKDGSTRSASFRDGATNDYFSQPRIASMTNNRSMPATPTGKGITFSPRIQFHDAWSASDYDRRGDIATCNRLTPILAQQIKEELNTFKMEMEVHESSKPHTHFF